MKTVFTNSQVAHIWAQQIQSQGRNSGNSLYFSDTEIYSYGPHFLAAKIYKGNTVLINSHRYSISTSNHLNDIWNATTHYRQFFVSCPNNPLQSIQDSLNDIIDAYITNYNCRKYTKWSFEIDINLIKKHNELCIIFDQPSYILPIKFFLQELKELVRYKEWQYKQNNTPEMLEKKRIKAEKAALAKQHKLEMQLQEDLMVFERSAVIKPSLRVISPQRIAVSMLDNEVVTTRGARVPLAKALLGIKLLQQGQSIIGMKLGSFTVDKIEGDLITIGCHTLSISQAIKTLKRIGIVWI